MFASLGLKFNFSLKNEGGKDQTRGHMVIKVQMPCHELNITK